jgi:hypothetical protein
MSTNTSEQIQPAATASITPASLPKYTIQVLLDGFPVVVELEGKAEALTGIVKRLKEIGATPPVVAAAPVTTASASNGADLSAPPKCPTHNATMKESRKPGQWFCSKKEGEAYCDYKVKR